MTLEVTQGHRARFYRPLVVSTAVTTSPSVLFHFRDINTSVYVTASDLEKSFSFDNDNIIEIIGYACTLSA